MLNVCVLNQVTMLLKGKNGCLKNCVAVIGVLEKSRYCGLSVEKHWRILMVFTAARIRPGLSVGP